MNLHSSNGLMLLFYQKTGALASVLLDEGYLTDVRTAVAGAIAAKHLAPRHAHRIGILGTGVQSLSHDFMLPMESAANPLYPQTSEPVRPAAQPAPD
ncbi:MAG: hypothetical protein LAP85_03105 [Acidobacteriia bacterium]|nr:hypothetical protein [Terriglobia bacterium]